MLSRVADSLYWMSRYIERAEHTARLIAVKLESMVEQTPEDAAASWARVTQALTGVKTAPLHLDAFTITRYLAFDRDNDNSLITSLSMARDNARQVREALREYTISDGQRELDSFFTTTGQMVDFKKGRQWVNERDPDLFKATWPELVIPDPKLAGIAGDYINKSSAAVVAWLDKNPQIDWVMWRGAFMALHA